MTDLTKAIAAVRRADAELLATGGPLPLPVGGLAAIVAGAVAALGRGDWWAPGLRELAGATLRDVPLDRLQDGLAGARPYKVAPPTASAALRALTAVGLGHTGATALVHLGVGSAADGALHEALNMASLLRSNVIFLVAIDPLDGDAPLGPQLAASPSDLADAFGLTAVVVDGADAAAVSAAVTSARAAGGPHLIEARLPARSQS